MAVLALAKGTLSSRSGLRAVDTGAAGALQSWCAVDRFKRTDGVGERGRMFRLRPTVGPLSAHRFSCPPNHPRPGYITRSPRPTPHIDRPCRRVHTCERSNTRRRQPPSTHAAPRRDHARRAAMRCGSSADRCAAFRVRGGWARLAHTCERDGSVVDSTRRVHTGLRRLPQPCARARVRGQRFASSPLSIPPSTWRGPRGAGRRRDVSAHPPKRGLRHRQRPCARRSAAFDAAGVSSGRRCP